MKKKLIKKVARYIELSKEFEQKESDLFDVNPIIKTIYNGYIPTPYISTNGISFVSGNETIEKTRAEVIKEKAESEAARADRYDEYIELRKELLKICEALI